MTTKEYIQHLEREEKRCKIRAMITDDPAVKTDQKIKEKRTMIRRNKLQRLWNNVNLAAIRYNGKHVNVH